MKLHNEIEIIKLFKNCMWKYSWKLLLSWCINVEIRNLIDLCAMRVQRLFFFLFFFLFLLMRIISFHPNLGLMCFPIIEMPSAKKLTPPQMHRSHHTPNVCVCVCIYIYRQSLEKIQLNFNWILNFAPCVPFNF